MILLLYGFYTSYYNKIVISLYNESYIFFASNIKTETHLHCIKKRWKKLHNEDVFSHAKSKTKTHFKQKKIHNENKIPLCVSMKIRTKSYFSCIFIFCFKNTKWKYNYVVYLNQNHNEIVFLRGSKGCHEGEGWENFKWGQIEYFTLV